MEIISKQEQEVLAKYELIMGTIDLDDFISDLQKVALNIKAISREDRLHKFEKLLYISLEGLTVDIDNSVVSLMEEDVALLSNKGVLSAQAAMLMDLLELMRLEDKDQLELLSSLDHETLKKKITYGFDNNKSLLEIAEDVMDARLDINFRLRYVEDVVSKITKERG